MTGFHSKSLSLVSATRISSQHTVMTNIGQFFQTFNKNNYTEIVEKHIRFERKVNFVEVM